MSSSSSVHIKTAVITGACSGMGRALTYSLLAKPSLQWRVVLANIDATAYDSIASTLDAARHIFIRTDVSSWTDHLALFKQAHAWSNGRIDFFAANADITDKESLLPQPSSDNDDDLDADPRKPNLACIEVDLLAIFYGLKLFIHFARKTRRQRQRHKDVATSGSDDIRLPPFRPKMVVTASMAGQYPLYTAPQYTAAKHGCVGLVRTSAPALWKYEALALNCIMPAFIETNIIPRELAAQWPREHVTPLATVMRAFDELIDEAGRVEQDSKSSGTDGVVKSGCAVECVVEELFHREPVAYANASQEWLTDQTREGGIIDRVVKERGAMQPSYCS